MKKLIITENQFDCLRKSILEADNKDRGEMGKFVLDMKKQFTDNIANSNISDNIDFLFGKLGEDGLTLIQDSSFQIIFKIIEIENPTVKLEYVKSSRHDSISQDFEPGQLFNLYANGFNGIHYCNGTECCIGFSPITVNKDENGNETEEYGKIVNIPLFRGVLTVPKVTKTNTDEVFNEYQELEKEAYKRFNTKELEYKSGLFGFNNWFIPATGKSAIDNTLASFGLYVNHHSLNNDNRSNIKTKVTVLDDLITANGDVLQPKTPYPANIQDNLVIVYNRNTKFIFDANNQDIMNGGEFICDVSYQAKGDTEIPLEQKSKIRILKPR
jgi:hypothetical protein